METNEKHIFRLLDLPEEIVAIIFRFQRLSGLRNLRLTSKEIRDIVDSNACVLGKNYSSFNLWSESAVPFVRDKSQSYESDFGRFLKNFSWVRGITTRGIVADKIFPMLPKNLVHLHLLGCTLRCDDSFALLPRNLRLLNLSNFLGIADDSLQYLPETLQYLNLGNCIGITDEAVFRLPRRLKYLSLYGCSQVTDWGLRNPPPGLYYLNISYCRVTNAVLNNIPKRCQVIHTHFLVESK